MYKHHEDSIKNMIRHYRANPEIKALFLIGSIATKTERPDSDIDGVAVVTDEYYEQIKASGEYEETYYGKCTYEGGYFNIHYTNRDFIENIVKKGNENVRNMFDCAHALFCDEPCLEELVKQAAVFPKNEKSEKQLKFYSTLKVHNVYYWNMCKPQGFARLHIAQMMVYCIYRLILLENEVLFPSMRKLEEYVMRTANKPDELLKKCRCFMETFADDIPSELVKCYEEWTSYDYPKKYKTALNNNTNPFEWI